MRLSVEQAARILVVLRDYRAARDKFLTEYQLTGKHHDLAFMAMCNEYAAKLGTVISDFTFGEVAAHFVDVRRVINGAPFGAPDHITSMYPLDRYAFEELLGCYLGLLRAQRKP